LKVIGGALSTPPSGGKPTKDLGPPPAVPTRTPSNPVSRGGPWVQSGYAMATKDFPDIFGQK